MSLNKPTKLAAPFDHILADVIGIPYLADRGEPTFYVELRNREFGGHSRRPLDYAEAEAEAVLTTIRKHKAQIKREEAGA